MNSQFADNPLLVILRKLIFGGGVGAGALIVWMLAEVVRTKPEVAMAVITQWGAMPVVLLVGMYFANARAGDWMAVMRDNTKAQQDLACAVNKIAEKDDRAVEEQKVMIAYVGQQLDKVLFKLDTIYNQNQYSQSGEKAQGVSA